MSVEKMVACLAGILQQQSNEIRMLKVITVALGSLWMEQWAREGMSDEEIRNKYEQLVRDAEKKGPPFDPENKVAKEIEEILAYLNLMEAKEKETPS
jgi:transcription initiation factor TFIIIB Brf1 subunit/transcription initiation factor TFIIB